MLDKPTQQGDLIMKAYTDIPIDPWYQTWLHSLYFLTDAPHFYREQVKKHGATHRYKFFGVEYVKSHGPEMAELIFKNSHDAVGCAPGWESLLTDFFPGGLLLKDGKHHLVHRRIMQHAFNKTAMLGYFDKIQRWAIETVGALPENQSIDFYPFIKEKTLDLALSMFLGVNNKTDLGRDIAIAFSDTVAGTLALVRKPILNNKYHRGVKGRETLITAFAELVKQRRIDPGDDLVSFLCQAEDEDGTAFTDEQIVNHLIFTMMAAHDTTASSLSSLLYHVTLNPKWLEAMQQEGARYDTLNYELLPELIKTENVFKETLRISPPLISMPRIFSKDVELNGYSIPANTMTGVNIFDCHHDTRYWHNPDEFDPTRFERKEDKQHQFQYIPFGGGVHKCIGMHLAQMEAKIFLHTLVTRFDIKRAEPDKPVRFTTVPIWRPKDVMTFKFTLSK